MLTTYVEAWTVIARPMATMGIDDDGTLWFMCKRDSPQATQVHATKTVHLTYSDHAKQK